MRIMKYSCAFFLMMLAGCSGSDGDGPAPAGGVDGGTDATSEAAVDSGTPDSSQPDVSMQDTAAQDVDEDAAQDGEAESSAPDAPDDAVDGGDASTHWSRCGASPHDWLDAQSMGSVLEQQSKASHSVVELGLGLLSLINDGAIKTTRLPQHATKAELIRYQTQDRGQVIDATALVTYPDETGTFPVLLVLHGTSGFNDSCAPTMGMATGDWGGFDDELGLMMSLYASFGYVTVFPDYIGLKSLGDPTGFLHPYLVAEPTAIASLDAVRATQKLLAGAGPNPGDVVVIGGSQGGHAAAFVNRYAPHYAPELTIRGSVWDVPPTDLMEQTRAAWGTTWVNATDNAIAFFTAAESWYGSAPGGLSEVLLAPYDTLAPETMMTECGGLEITDPVLEDVITAGALAAADAPEFGDFEPWDCYLKENTLSTSSVPHVDAIPSLFLLGENDSLVNNDVERAAFVELCAQGHELVYLECAGASHTQPLVWAFDQTLDFLEARLQGDPMPGDTCQLRPAEHCTSEP